MIEKLYNFSKLAAKFIRFFISEQTNSIGAIIIGKHLDNDNKLDKLLLLFESGAKTRVNFASVFRTMKLQHLQFIMLNHNMQIQSS